MLELEKKQIKPVFEIESRRLKKNNDYFESENNLLKK